MSPIRMTYATARVLLALDAGAQYGFDIAEVAGLRGGTVYPILRRLEEEGLARSSWERPEIGRREGRPPRKYYQLRAVAQPLVREARERFPFPLRGVSDLNPERAR
ncbi:MAG: PadR family transcriptional regulator [Longimicrobiales bacterium]